MLPHYLPTVVRKHQAFRPQQFLYFLPLPQGQGSLGYTFAFSRFTGPFCKDDAIAISAGPGSFTGLRIGAATAKGLGLALNLPLVEVPTLEGLAFNLWGTDKLVCPIMDARRNQVYTGIYEFCKEEIPEKESSEHQLVMHSIKEQYAIAVDELVEELNRLGREVIFLGDGVPVYREQILQKLKVPCSFAPAANNRQRAASVASLGAVYYAHGRTVTAAEHEPEYLRKSQAEREREEQEKAAKEAQA